jgi:hypothetical protein
MKADQINVIERYQMEALIRILNSPQFSKDLKSVESYIQQNYEKLHFHWGIKNKLKLAAERLVRFHIWKHMPGVDLYNTPLSSDVAFIMNDCVLNIDCKTIDLSGNPNDRKYIQCEANQANFENIDLQKVKVTGTSINFEGYTFYPMLEKFFDNKPVLSFFIFINYHDNGKGFEIKELEICCLPHNEIVIQQYSSKLISGFKTYKYLKEMQAEKYDKYYLPSKNIKPHWIEFKIGKTKRYFDDRMKHPFDSNKLLVWGFEGNQWQVVIGGHTIRVPKKLIENRIDRNSSWKGWVKIPIN